MHPLLKRLKPNDKKLLVEQYGISKTTLWLAQKDLDNRKFRKVKKAIIKLLEDHEKANNRVLIKRIVCTARGIIKPGKEFDRIRAHHLKGTWIEYQGEPLILLPMEYEFI